HILEANAGARDEEMADREHELADDTQSRLMDQQIEGRVDRALDRVFDGKNGLFGETGLDARDARRKRGERDELFRWRPQQRRFLTEGPAWTERGRRHTDL